MRTIEDDVQAKAVEAAVTEASKRAWSRHEMGYGTRQLERGELFQLQGLLNDHLLVKLNYAVPCVGVKGVRCETCKRTFVDEQFCSLHVTSKRCGSLLPDPPREAA